jgi:hypothetical protein
MPKAKGTGNKIFRTHRSLLMAFASILGVMGIVALLLVVKPGTRIGDHASPRKSVAGTASEAPNSKAVSKIPNSFAVVQSPLKARSSPSSSASAIPSKSARASTNNSGTSGSGNSGSGNGPITAGDSKTHCIILKFPYGILNLSTVAAASSLTGITYNCLGTFANPMPTWADWETPWMFATAPDGWDKWLAANSAHQVVMGMDLIPQVVSDISDPLTWEQACAVGSYNQYATKLAKNLVSYGAGNIVIRLGVEANGSWEADYVGSTTAEMNDWAKCFDNEVTAMRAVPGAHFLFVWNPNACTADLPLNEWYPGNSYVDIIGIDSYDQDCSTMKTVSQEGWAAFSTNGADNTPNNPDFPSLANMEVFAVANGKPLSIPEWGLIVGSPDDATYVADMGQMFNTDDFAFESYFDTDNNEIAPLGSTIPDATSAYSQVFK